MNITVNNTGYSIEYELQLFGSKLYHNLILYSIILIILFVIRVSFEKKVKYKEIKPIIDMLIFVLLLNILFVVIQYK